MKFKKSLILILSFMMIIGILVSAKPSRGGKDKGPVVMGQVIEVNKDQDGKVTSITVEGFIKGDEVMKIKLVGLISEDTKILNSAHDPQDKILIEKGDLVSMRVNMAMTKSNPPQSNIIRMFISK